MRSPVVLFLSLIASPLWATALELQPAPTEPTAAAAPDTIDSNVRRDVVAKLSDALRNNYIFPDVGEKAADKINAEFNAGAYDSLSDPSAFAARLSSDVAAVAHDKHLSIVSAVGPRPAPPKDPEAIPPRAEAGITRADKLAGGIGYIELTGFPPLPAFKPVVDKAMLALKGSHALIIDDRRNHGGSPDAVDYFVSFLVWPKKTLEIDDIVSRTPNTNNFTRERVSSQPTPVSFAGIPVYVLTSNETFAGAEELAYDVQTHKLGKIVGEITGGGANPTGPVDLGHEFMAMIPFGRAENPVTKTNWEGRGVQPDIAVPAADALKAALTQLGGKPAPDIEIASVAKVFAPRSTPLPGSEAIARQFIAGVFSGNMDYAAMTSEFADFNREHLPTLRQRFQPLGELRSTEFEGPGVVGGDEYRMSFANGAIIVDVVITPEGKLAGAMMKPAPADK